MTSQSDVGGILCDTGELVANCLTLSLRWTVADAIRVFTHTTVFKTLFTVLGNSNGLIRLQPI